MNSMMSSSLASEYLSDFSVIPGSVGRAAST